MPRRGKEREQIPHRKIRPVMLRKILYLILLAGIPVFASGQESGTFDFSGSSRLEARISSQKNTIYNVPKDYMRWGANAVVKAWGLPIRASWLVNTGNELYNQSLNQFRLSVNYQEFLKSKILNKAPWLKFIRRLDIGKTYPDYSRLSLSGIPVDGVNAEIAPGPLYMAFVYGRIRRSIYEDGYPALPYNRMVRYYRAGMGDRLSSHIHFGYMKAWDHDVSLPDSLKWEAPSVNNVLSADMAAYFLKRKIYIKAEGAVSLFTENSLATEYTEEELPRFVVERFHPNLTSSVDYAWVLESGINLKTTRIKAFYRMINPGFRSLGTGIMRNDISEYGMQVTQNIYKRYISLNAKVKRDLDNLLGTKYYQSSAWHYGFGINIRIPEYPWLMVNYSPYEQYRETPVSTQAYIVRVMSSRAGYSFINGSTRLMSSLGYSRQITLSGIDEKELGRLSNIYSLTESASFDDKWQVSLASSWNRMRYGEDLRNLISGSFNLRYKVNKKINTFGGYQRFQSLGGDSRNRFQLGGGIEMRKWGEIRLSAERFSGYNDKEDKRYNDNVMQLSWVVNF
jgi:hypothetical protein